MFRQYITCGRTGLCIISDRHAAIKNSMTREFSEPVGYHRYCSRHFVSNFNTRFKNIVLNNMLHDMCDEPSKQEFYRFYENLIELDNKIKKWLEVELKEK